jgi:predicted permease
LSEAVLGDLHEEFVRRARRTPLRARAVYWRDALGVSVRYLIEHELAGRRRRRLQNRREHTMDQILLNTRYALRRLTKAPAFTLVAILSLGLGIGANTAMFSLVNAVILRDLPFEDVASLVDVYLQQDGFSHGTLSYPDYEDLLDGSAEAFTAVSGSQLTFVQTDVDGGVEMVPAEAVTGNYFSLAGVTAAVGRTFGPEDDVAPGAHPVAVLGYGYWQRRFGADPEVVGSEVRLSGRAYTVIGVAPEAYTGNLRGIVPELFVPIMMYDEIQGGTGSILEARGNQSLFAKARLAPGVTMAQAEAVVARIGARLHEDYPRHWTPDKDFVVVATADVIMNPMIDRVLTPAAAMIMAVVGLVLLIACANLASFLLARAADRRKEIAVRLAMGARRRALVGQLLTETIILAGLGGVVGIGLATWSLGALVRADLPLPLPISLDLSLDGTVLVFSLAVSLAAGVLFGLAPAIQGTNPDVAPTLRDESAGGGRARGAALRNMLVVGQVAVSMILLVGAGLFLRSLGASANVDPGFGDAPTGVLKLVLAGSRYSEDEAHVYLASLEERLASLPEVEQVGLIDNLMLNTLSTQTVRLQVDGVEPPPGRDFHSVDVGEIDEGFLAAAGIPLLNGRTIQEGDDADSEAVALVNQTFARRYFAGEDPVGRSIRVNGEETLVVGMTGDTKVRQLGEEPRPYLYLSHRQSYSSFVTILARTSGDAGALALRMFSEARALDPEIMVVENTTMARHLAIMLLPRQLGALVVSGFAFLALILASIGLYGTVSYAVSRRAREVGIRLSLGAEAGNVVWMLTAGGMKLVAVGAALGLGLAALLAQLLSRLLYGVQALDPATFAGVALALCSVALLASWIPARRASRVDPVTALRSD